MKVLTDDETYKFSYPKSTVELLKYKPYWSFSRKEQMLFRRIISSLTLNNTSLENYLSNIEEIMVKSLEDFSSMNRPIELLKEMKNVSFKVIVGLFMGSYDERFMSKIGNSFSHMHSALFCMPFNLPGFAFRRGLIVSIFNIFILLLLLLTMNLIRICIVKINSFKHRPNIYFL